MTERHEHKTVRIDAKSHRLLTAIARREDRPRSWVVERAIEEYAKNSGLVRTPKLEVRA